MTQYALPLTLPPAFTADNFFVSASNRDAYRWIEVWPEWPAHALLLYGPPGSGKSHLGQLWAERAQASVLPASTAFPDIAGIRGNWLVEDIEQLREERPLLHLFNYTKENNASLLLTSTLPPPRLPFALPDLTSRLLAIPSARILEADDEVLAAAMRKQFADRQMKVDDEVIAYMLPRMERSLAKVKELVERLDRQALAEHKNLTIPFVRQAIEEK